MVILKMDRVVAMVQVKPLTREVTKLQSWKVPMVRTEVVARVVARVVAKVGTMVHRDLVVR